MGKKKGTENWSPWEVGLLTSQWGVKREFSCSPIRDCRESASLSLRTASLLWLCWVFVAARGRSLVSVSRGSSSRLCAGVVLQWLLSWQSASSQACGLQELQPMGSAAVALSSRAQAELLQGLRDLRGPGIEPVPPALAGGLLATEPPGSLRISSLLRV